VADKKEEKKVEFQIPTFDKKDIEENKVYGAIGYLGILFLIPLLLKKDSKFAMACAKQGIVITGCQIISSVLIPVVGIGVLLNFAVTIIIIIGFIKAITGNYFRVPLVGEFGEKINI